MEIRMVRQACSWGDAIDVMILDRENHSVVRKIEFERVPVGTGLSPAFSIDNDVAQKMMDSLWDCGIRPSEGTGSAGAMAATQKHLEDMRTLVFKKKV